MRGGKIAAGARLVAKAAGDAVKTRVQAERRVVVEHFDLLYPHLNFNAQIILGIGEEVVVARPNVFGPHPEAIREIVYRTVKFRKMAHSAEDITSLILSRQYGYPIPDLHSDVKHGFVIGFADPPAIDLKKLEADVLDYIRRDLPIMPADEEHIRIGDEVMECTGIRTHMKSTGEIESFRLLPELRFDPIDQRHLLVGVVGDAREEPGFDRILKIVG